MQNRIWKNNPEKASTMYDLPYTFYACYPKIPNILLTKDNFTCLHFEALSSLL